MLVKETEAANFVCCNDRTQNCIGAYCMGWVPETKIKHPEKFVAWESDIEFVDTGRGHCGRVEH